jgi:hypothetical protein
MTCAVLIKSFELTNMFSQFAADKRTALLVTDKYFELSLFRTDKA